MEYTVAVAVVLPWDAMTGPTKVSTERTAARAMATTVALAVEAPCTTESRGPCRGNPRISTVARAKTHARPRECHGHCRGPPPRSQIMCICAIRRGRGYPYLIVRLWSHIFLDCLLSSAVTLSRDK